MSEQIMSQAETVTGALLAGGRLRVDFVERSVWLDGKIIELGGRSFELLCAFMKKPMHLIGKDELIDEVWEGKAVSDAVLTTAIRDLRQALGDDAKRPAWIKTEHGRGYRFIARVVLADGSIDAAEVDTPEPGSAVHADAGTQPSAGVGLAPWQIWGACTVLLTFIGLIVLQFIPQTDGVRSGPARSVAILSFENLSSDEEADWLAAGLSEELANALARVPDLRVASRRATREAAADGATVAEIANALGVSSLLEGSIRVADSQVRVSVSMVAASDSRQLWTEQFDRDLSDILSLQSEIAAYVASTLETSLDPEALRRMSASGTQSIAAFEAYLRAQAKIAEFEQIGAAEAWHEAGEYLDRARSIDPHFAEVHALSALVFRLKNTPSLVMQANALSGEAYRREYAARMDAAVAAARDPVQAAGFRAVRDLELFELRSAREAFEVYVSERPNDINTAFDYVTTLAMLGEHATAQRVVRRLDATIPETDATNRAMLIRHALRSRDFDFAAQVARQSLTDHPFHSITLIEAHWALLRVGDYDLAREVVERLEASEVGFLAKMGVQMHQFCADGLRDQAELIAEQFFDHPQSYIFAWHAYRAMNNDEAAYARLLELDQPGPPRSRLRALLAGDPAFDPSQFAHLSRAILAAGGRLSAPADPLVRCPPA